MDDTPTSKTLGIFIGEVEVEGVCVSTAPIRAKFCYKDCVIYKWGIDEEWKRWETETYTDNEGRTRTRRVLRSGWTTIAGESLYQGFYLKDEFGYVWVHPKGSDYETLSLFEEYTYRGGALYVMGPDEEISDSTGRRRFYESGIPVGTELFIRGRASERPDIVAPQIVEDPLAEMFIITYRKEKDISSGKATAYVLWNLVGLVTAMGIGALLTPNNPQGPVIGLAIYVFAWFAGWVWMVFNSLIGLRNRVQQAQSLIDVQLKRRSDLIPPLVSSLKGLRDYESKVQTEIATLRSQSMGATQVSALAPGLKAVIEKYP
ncbi:MAG: LemA domain-containing protein, partial [Opitutae bacterium]|nr:LemA domain-containing protein [Opitutae bacterium]